MPAEVADLEQRISALAADGFAGAVRIDVGGNTELRAAYGLADRARTVPVTVNTRLGIASGSKVLTALAVLSLVEDGTLALSTTARSLLGADLPLVAADVTVEHLLCHRSGIGHYPPAALLAAAWPGLGGAIGETSTTATLVAAIRQCYV